MDRDLHTSYSRVSLRMILSDLAKYSMTWGIVRPLRDSWTSCIKHQSYISHVHEKTVQRDIDNIIVDVFKIICCSEPTDYLPRGGAVGSVEVRAAWLWWSVSLGSKPSLAGSLCQVIAAYALRLNYRAGTEGSTVSSLTCDRWLILGLETLSISRCLNHW